MKNTLNKLFDLLFPPRENQLLLREYSFPKIIIHSGHYDGIYYCTDYTESVIKAAVVENKFYNSHLAQITLAEILVNWVIKKQLTDVCFMPIPLGKERLRKRGHNQVLSVLKETDYKIISAALSRKKETVPQSTMNRADRLRNVRNVFSCDKTQLKNIDTQTIILIDDVVTTGATLNEARATIAPHLPPQTKLICLALAH